MRRVIASLILLLSATLAAAQVPFPQTLPANTVYGRLGISAGPGQAIPFSVLAQSLSTQAWVNVRDYATGNCTTDDSAAIQVAIDSLPNGGTVYFPPAPGGCYAIGSATAITFPVTKPVWLRGAGRGLCPDAPCLYTKGTVLKAIASIGSMIKTSAVTFSRGHRISDMVLDGNNLATIGLQLDFVGSGIFESLDVVNNTSTNIRLGNTGLNPLENLFFAIRMDNPILSHTPASLPDFNIDVWGSNNHFISIIAANAKTANFRARSNAGNNVWVGVHAFNWDWTNQVATAASVNAFLIEASGNQIQGWEADGSSAANVQLNGFQNILINGVSRFDGIAAQKGVQFGNGTCGNLVLGNVFTASTDVNTIIQAGSAGCNPGNNYNYNTNETTGTLLSNTVRSGVNGSVGGNLTLFGLTSGNAQIVPPAAAGTPTLTTPTSTGTLTESNVTTYATDGLIYGTGTSTLTNADRCGMNSNQGISCSSATAFAPEHNVTNTTNDTSNALVTFNKSRSGGSTNNNDGLGTFQFKGFANGAQQNTAQVTAVQNAASSGSNIPSRVELVNSNAAGQLNQRLRFDHNAHLSVSTQATVPSITAGCNGAGSSITGGAGAARDLHGTVTGQTAAATTCTITFGTPYTNTPDCAASGLTSPLTGAITPSTTTLVVNFASTANYKWSYVCMGN